MKNYIKLPVIQSFSIKKYSLFKDDWGYTLIPGLNILLGANAIGKTTTINLLISGLVGDYVDSTGAKIDSKYFIERFETEFDGDVTDGIPQIEITFLIGKDEICIVRSILNNEISDLSINKKSVKPSDDKSLTQLYEEKFKKLSGLTDLDDLSFILSKLLIREEEGNYLLWDQVAQSRILRLLANISGFQSEFKVLESALQDADSHYKRQADFLAKMRGRKKELEADRSSDLSQKKSFQSKEEIEKKLSLLKLDRIECQSKIDGILGTNSALNSQIEKSYLEIDTLKGTINIYEEELNTIEKHFYKQAFNSFKTQLAYQKLDQRHSCIVCNTNLPEVKAKQVLQILNTTHNCPLCESKIITEPESKTKTAGKDKLTMLYGSIKKQTIEYEAIQSKIPKLISQVEANGKEIQTLTEQLKEINLSILSTQNNLSQLQQQNSSEITDYDMAIKRLDDDIANYEEVVKPLLEEFNAKKLALTEKNIELNSTIDTIESKLNQIFNKHASKYFNETCMLHLRRDKKPAGLEVALSYFLPTFDNKLRLFQGRVSKSEAIFLEYLFRISILQLYNDLTGIKSFLILETSEGSFDITNTDLIGETFADIGKLGFPFVVITNLSKVEFIKSMIPLEKERKKRIYNLLSHSKLSANQKKKEKKLLEALKELGVN